MCFSISIAVYCILLHLGHYGCVNAVEFSRLGGDFLASGGDDRRVLLWRVDEALWTQSIQPRPMIAEHHSNIFCIAFDNHDQTLLSGGNDEQVIVHDVVTGEDMHLFSYFICISRSSI